MRKKIFEICKRQLSDKRGELLYFESAWKIVVAVVIGAMMLTLLVTLFHDPISIKIEEYVERYIDFAHNLYSQYSWG